MKINKKPHPEPFFIADHLALDFLNTKVAPRGTEMEWLGNGSDLLSWLKRTKLVPPAVITQYQEQTNRESLDDIATQARKLREWFRQFINTHAGKSIHAAVATEIDPINHLLTLDNSHRELEVSTLADPALESDASVFVMKLHRQWHSPQSLLIPIAEVLSDLLCHVDFNQIKNCEGRSCTLWFNDISKNHARKWCVMAVCGNRAKAAAYRTKNQK